MSLRLSKSAKNGFPPVREIFYYDTNSVENVILKMTFF